MSFFPLHLLHFLCFFLLFLSKLDNLFKAEINYIGYILSLVTFSGKLNLPKFSAVSSWLHDTWYCPLPLSPTLLMVPWLNIQSEGWETSLICVILKNACGSHISLKEHWDPEETTWLMGVRRARKFWTVRSFKIASILVIDLFSVCP